MPRAGAKQLGVTAAEAITPGWDEQCSARWD
jgi:hypothetical protein